MSMQKNSKTVDKYGGVNHTPEKENINAYRVKGEILTAIQEPGFIGGISTIGVAALIGGKTGGLYGGLGGALLGGGLDFTNP